MIMHRNLQEGIFYRKTYPNAGPATLPIIATSPTVGSESQIPMVQGDPGPGWVAKAAPKKAFRISFLTPGSPNKI